MTLGSQTDVASARPGTDAALPPVAGASVDAHEQPLLGEHCDVATDRGRRGSQFGGQVAQQHVTTVGHHLQQLDHPLRAKV